MNVPRLRDGWLFARDQEGRRDFGSGEHRFFLLLTRTPKQTNVTRAQPERRRRGMS